MKHLFMGAVAVVLTGMGALGDCAATESGAEIGIAGTQIAQGMRACEPNCGTGGASNSRESPGSVAHVFRTLDKNGDGKIGRDEFRGPPQRFKVLDEDGDGAISKDEFASAQARKASGAVAPQQAPSNVPKLPVLLTHTHIVAELAGGTGTTDWSGAVKNALKTMDELGIRRALVMPPPAPQSRNNPADLDDMIASVKAYPQRFAVVGGGASLNGMIESTPPDRVSAALRRRFTERAEAIIGKGAVGFGEMTALHFALFKGHPFEVTRPDHPLFLLLADIAAKHDVPIDLHVEAVTSDWRTSDQLRRQSSDNPRQVAENISALERLLAHNPRAKIIWVHVGMDNTGQRTVALTHRMLRKYANLYLSITGFQQYDVDDWFLRPGEGVNPAWRELILEFPDRFMIGSDTFFLPDNARVKIPLSTPVALALVRTPALPPDIRKKVAFENAQHLFKLGGASGSQRVASTAPAPAVAAAPPRAKPAARILSEAEIRQTVIGNTLSFTAPSNGQNIFVYFADDGTAETKGANPAAKPVRKQWFFNEKGLLCRTVGRRNQNHCTRVQSTGDAQTLSLFNQKVRYQAAVLAGRNFTR